MKQNRTVKSLLPPKYTVSGRFLMVLLLVLSVMLCLGAASLWTASVRAEDPGPYDNNIYSGYNDNIEVIYKLYFLDPSNLSGDSVNEFYMENNSLYFINGVKVGNNTGGNSLGGSGNDMIYSSNITLIAGNGNKMGGNGVSVLGGIENKSEGDNSVIAGGKKNSVSNVNGVILGGSGNQISGGNNSVILGGQGNVTKKDNVIIGGKNVKVYDVGDIFVFSNQDSEFKPETSKSFYLNLTNGVGINANSIKSGLSVSGAVGFGKIDINSNSCNNSNIGVEGSWDGCLVSCTKKSSSSSKWELLDRGNNCEDKCGTNNNKCMFKDLSSQESDYTAFCTKNINNATQCSSEGGYANVVFQSILIDSEEDCSRVGDNKCAFYCNAGYKKSGNVCVDK